MKWNTYVYNTRLRSRNISADFYDRLTSALVNDIQNENNDVVREEVDPYESDDDDTDVDYVPFEDASDIENEIEIEPNEILDSDEEEVIDGVEEEERETPAATEISYYGKDGTEWKKESNEAIRTRAHNIMCFRPGPKQQNSVPIEVFKQFFITNISFIIISQTNRCGRDQFAKCNAENLTSKPKVWVDFTSTELDAFIGILVASGVTHNNMQFTPLLWQTDSLPIFRAAMPLKRFKLLTRYIRFDDGRTRSFRLQSDKAAAIRDIWNFLNENLARNYEPHENVTIDEQLFPYRGKTKFTQFIPSKPAKYGVKIWWACDSQTKYPLQGILYTGKKDGGERKVNQVENVLLKLVKRYQNTGRTIVADNFFTTLTGAKQLATIGLAFVGTIRANKKCLPEELKKNPSGPLVIL
ncbi:piggyBac transposable element-derived protein 4-like [Bactrocera neohumeralis]|uniref:piggyBac transposable element-derived protein 4-like n=1 Tax=Bactrocera neohumeralis TaxID=98809 RepID=UPI002165D58D|nr:piggyBac transposable element-derived protein 4-like [Bactrocera neohumeralis]